MNKNDFLKRLEHSLKHIPKEDREDALIYYREYFEEMGVDDILDVTAEVGIPEAIAKDIIANCTEKHFEEQKERGGIRNNATAIWMIILALFASPIAIPIALTALLTLFAILLAVFSVIAAIVIAGVAFIGSGFVILVSSIFALGFAQKLVCIGLGLGFAGIGLLLLVVMVLFGELCISGIVALFKAIFLRKKVA